MEWKSPFLNVYANIAIYLRAIFLRIINSNLIMVNYFYCSTPFLL